MSDCAQNTHFYRRMGLCLIGFCLSTIPVSEARIPDTERDVFGLPQLPQRHQDTELERTRVHSPFEDSTALRGNLGLTNPSVTRAVGRMQYSEVIENGNTVTRECTATLVSPPNSAITTVVYAAHCVPPTGVRSTFIYNGGSAEGFECARNRDYQSQRNFNQDVGICFLRRPLNTGLYACLRSTAARPLRTGDRMRVFGFGNPTVGQAPVQNLLSGDVTLQPNRFGGQLTSDPNGNVRTTPGDSGGPISLLEDTATQAGYFHISGVVSGAINLGRGRAPMDLSQDIFAPFSQGNMEFFQRAIQGFRAESPTLPTPQICGLNFNPNGETLPTTPPPLQAARPSSLPTPGSNSPPTSTNPPQARQEQIRAPQEQRPQLPTGQLPIRISPSPERSQRIPTPPQPASNVRSNRNYIRLGRNVIAVNGRRVPTLRNGERPIGYRIGPNRSVQFVFQRR